MRPVVVRSNRPLPARTNTPLVDGARPETSRRRTRRRMPAVVTVVVTVALSGCAAGTGQSRDADTAPSTSAASTSAEPATEPALDETAQAIDALVGSADARPDTADLPAAPDGFSPQEVEAFAGRAIDIIERGVSPELAGKTPAEAYDYLFAGQEESSRATTEQASAAAAGQYDWQWAFASLFETEPVGEARFLTSRWQVETTNSRLADGTPAKALQVTLSVAVEHLLPDTADASTTTPPPGPVLRPVVMQRTVIIRGIRPLGGPEWWPAIGIQANPLFGGKCAPVNGALLTPARRPETLAEDLDRLTDFINNPKRINAKATSRATDLASLVAEYCED